MFFRKKSQKSQPLPADYAQKLFKITAFIFLIFVLYETYSNDLKNRLNSDDSAEETPEEISQARINQKVQEAFDKMYENPEYKKIQDFVNHIENNIDKKNGTALKTPSGYLLYLPFDSVFKENAVPDSKIIIKSEETEFYIDYKIIHKAIDMPSQNIVNQAKDSNISELKTNIEKAEKNILLEEIAKKNGKVINLIDKDLPKPVAQNNNISEKPKSMAKPVLQANQNQPKLIAKPEIKTNEAKPSINNKIKAKTQAKPIENVAPNKSSNTLKPVEKLKENLDKKPIDLTLD